MNDAQTVNDESEIVSRMRRHRLRGLSEMAAGMAHEINQPLGGIRGFAEGLLIGLEEGWDISQQEIMAKMRRIITEVDRIDDLIQSIRAFSDENARGEVVVVDALTATQAAVRLIGSRIQTHGIELAVTSHGIKPLVRANPFGLQEVVQILLSNASDACRDITPPGHRQAVIAIAVDGAATLADPVVISITDNGAGMDAATLARAGEPFFTTKGPDHGVGLGLAMVRGILAQCCGSLDLHSEPGSGTTATIRLPQRYHREDES